MELLAHTTTGALRGREKDGVALFAGIPYAAAPIGERRFAPPQPQPGWSGERDATRFGSVAPQTVGAMEKLAGARPPAWDEDCLVLNVQTPALDGGRRPVMVWIHGGGFTTGMSSMPWYNGAQLVRHGDVVVVGINYRLGVLGWSAVDHLAGGPPGSANAGLLDQIAALQWVHDNIANFGGDPSNVTIFGESAGGMSVATLMGTPGAKGLFHKAVAQSGGAFPVRSADEAREITDRVARLLGERDVGGLRARSAEELLEAQTTVLAEQAASSSGFGMTFCPAVDGVVLPQAPLDAIAAGNAAGVPLIAGTTREEWNLFMLGARPPANVAEVGQRLGRLVGKPSPIVKAYEGVYGSAGPAAMWSALMTDFVFRKPVVALADAQLRHAPSTYVYRFDWPSSAFEGRMGAAHSIEIAFVFDNLQSKGVALFTGTDAPQSLADAMRDAWLAFAHSGDPNHEGLPVWPAHDSRARPTLLFDNVITVANDPDGAVLDAWPSEAASAG